MGNVVFTAIRRPICDECGFTIPTCDERTKLASMRDELLQDDWAYWHDDAAVLYLNRILGDEYPPFVPESAQPSTSPQATASDRDE